MSRSRLEYIDFKLIGSELGVSQEDVKRVVHSFFDSISDYAKKLPFDTVVKIYSKPKFDEYERVWNIPYIGRLGMSYNRYLKWRTNESKMIEQETRNLSRSRFSQDEIEHTAGEILAGRVPSLPKKKRVKEMYRRVWMVGRDGKRLARQVIPKKDK